MGRTRESSCGSEEEQEVKKCSMLQNDEQSTAENNNSMLQKTTIMCTSWGRGIAFYTVPWMEHLWFIVVSS